MAKTTARRRATKQTARKPAARKPAAKKKVARKAATTTARRAAAPSKPVVGWWEITLTNKADSDRVKGFFTEIFGWKIESDPQYDYGQVSHHDAGIGGGIGPSSHPGAKNQVTFYVEVDDIPAYLGRIEGAGGRTIMPATRISPTTEFAQFTDPAGNLIGLYRST